MAEKLNESARHVMEIAEEEARALGHEYVGTEHVLLGLAREGGVAAGVLAARGAGVDRVRAEVERLVHRGPGGEMPSGSLPRTPRARRAVELAGEEARALRQGLVGPEHLLMGLIREGEGVGAKVLAALGIEGKTIYAEVMRVRLGQLQVVERTVRPVRASTPRKRKMREELLAHLTGIYEQELEAGRDADAAMAEAAHRFGDPAELAKELEASVPRAERIGYAIDRQLGWRAPESVERYLARMTAWCFALMALLWCVAAGFTWSRLGVEGLWEALRPVTAMAVITPVSVFLVEWLYYRIRDTWWGVFGTRRSVARLLGWELLLGLSIVACGAAFGAMTIGGTAGIARMMWPCSAAAVGVALATANRARVRGPVEIEDTVWASLDVSV